MTLLGTEIKGIIETYPMTHNLFTTKIILIISKKFVLNY